jgi:hypothetical protein
MGAQIWAHNKNIYANIYVRSVRLQDHKRKDEKERRTKRKCDCTVGEKA